MTRDEAREAGELVEAVENIDRTIIEVKARKAGELVGIGCSVEHSDSGSSGCGPDALVPRDLAVACLKDMRAVLEVRLIELGVA
jgi:hypothetical protein